MPFQVGEEAPAGSRRGRHLRITQSGRASVERLLTLLAELEKPVIGDASADRRLELARKVQKEGIDAFLSWRKSFPSLVARWTARRRHRAPCPWIHDHGKRPGAGSTARRRRLRHGRAGVGRPDGTMIRIPRHRRRRCIIHARSTRIVPLTRSGPLERRRCKASTWMNSQ